MTAHVEPLRAGHEDYVLRAIAGGAEDYYLGGGEAPGRWLGGACDELALTGDVEPQALRAVLAGRNPITGAKLSSHRRSGFDVTFSPPKSVSALWGLSPDPGVTRTIREAHDEAVAAALGYLESQVAVVDVRIDGRRQVVTSNGLLAAAFLHRTSRSGDLNLHSHVVVANLTKADRDRWRALGRHKDLFAHTHTAGDLYEAELRKLLTERLGVEWTSGTAHPEILGVDQRVCEHFSRRRQEALAALERRGQEATPQALAVAVLATRGPKPAHTEERQRVAWSANAGDYGVIPDDNAGLSTRWRQEVVDAGLPPIDLEQIILRAPAPAVTQAQVDELGARLAGPDGLTASRSSFARRDAIAAFSGLPGVGAAQAITLADEWLASEQVVSLGSYHGAPARFTVPELVAREERLVAQAGEHVDAQVPVEIADAVTSDLEPVDAEAVRRLVRSDYRLDCVTGSGPAIDAAAEAWQAAGHQVIRIDASAKRHGEVRELLDAGVPDRAVVVVEAAGALGVRGAVDLADATQAANGKLVFVGDAEALERNCVFARLVAELGSIQVSGERVAQAVNGPIVRRGNTVVAGDRVAQTAAMIVDWRASREEGASALLVARRHVRVDELNAAARAARAAAGELGEQLVAGGRSYAVGDEVRFTSDLTGKWSKLHDAMPGIHAGATATVAAVNPDSGTVTVRTPASPEALARWDEAHEQQEREIRDLAGEMAMWIERSSDEMLLGSDREQARARVASTRARLDVRLAQRAAGLAVVDGRRQFRPGSGIVIDGDYLAAGHVSYAYAASLHDALSRPVDRVLVDDDTEQLPVLAAGEVHTYRVAPVELGVGSPGADAVARRRRQRELATRPADELAAERRALEVRLHRAERTAGDPVASAEAEARAAQARAERTGAEADRHAAWLAGQRLAQVRERAARQATRTTDQGAEMSSEDKDRLADLRAAETIRRRLEQEAGIEQQREEEAERIEQQRRVVA